MKLVWVVLMLAIARYNVLADVKVNNQDDFQTLNIDLSDPKLDIKKAAAGLKDAINKAAEEHQAQKGTTPRNKEEATEAEGEKPAAESTDDNPDTIEVDNDVLVLTEKNFDKAIKENPTILVEFYAPWCGHCMALAPQYEGAAKQLKDNEHPLALAKVDATVHKDLANKYDVSGYPTMKVFKNGVVSDYEGPRITEGIVEYMKERAHPDWKPPPSKVVSLTKENFDEFIQNTELALVEFFAPWCGHCKALKPKYEKAAQELAKENQPVTLATVDATEQKDLADRYGITGYPTLKIFRKGRVSDYKGTYQDEHSIVDFMTKQIGEGSALKEDLKQVKATMNVDDVTVGAFFESESDPVYQTYLDAANVLRNEFTFFHTFNKNLRDKYKVNAGSVVVFNAERFYTQLENKWHVLEKSDVTADEIQQFIHDHSVPLVGEYNTDTQNSRYPKKRPLCIFFFTVDFKELRSATDVWRKKIAAIASKHPKVTFTVADDEGMKSELANFGLDESNEEIKVGCIDDKNDRYRMEDFDEWDSDDVKQFISDVEKGKAKLYLKSQRAPKKQGDVITVVGNTFHELVLNKEKDVLLELYAPWCGHCKKLEPEYKKLAQQLKKEKNLVIAKMDATANTAPHPYTSSGFPTIYFKPAGAEEPKKFDGDRTVDGFMKYLKENAKASFKSKDEL